MQIPLKFQTLIELFNDSLSHIELRDKEYLEIVRKSRQEKLTFEALKTKAEDFALWLIKSPCIQTGDKIAILGKNRADWDVALWGIVLAGAATLALFILLAKAMPGVFPNRVDTWISRVEHFWDGTDGAGDYQIEKAKIAIASGGIVGNGAGKSVMKNFLPQNYKHTRWQV